MSLVERLRRYEKKLNDGLIEAPYLGEAADEIERLRADCIALMRIATEAYDADDLGMTFNDWLDMNGYRFGNEGTQGE